MSELRVLLRMAWPVILGHVAWMMLNVVDLVMVGRLGETALAGLALGNIWSFGVFVFGMGTMMGIEPLFSQAFGAGERRAAGQALARAVVLGLLLSVPLTALHLLAGPALRLLGQPEEIIPIAAAYSAALAWSVPGGMVFNALRGFLYGQALMRPAMVVVVGANLLNVAANHALIDGNWGAPALGAVGCGWATTLVRVTMAPALIAVAWPAFRDGWAGWAGAFDRRALWRMMALGGPVGFQIASEVEAFNAVGLMMGWLGPTELAAHTVAINIASLVFMVPLGLSAAAATRVGNLLGAGQPWARSAWVAVAAGCGMMSVSAVCFYTLPEPIVRLYTDDAAVVAIAATLLPLAAVFQVFDGAQVVEFGVLRGAGDTRMPAMVNLVGYWALGLPIGYGLAFHGDAGPQGVWWGLVIGLAVVALLLCLRLTRVIAAGGFLVLERE
ncbi:MAG: MATE family efflux transporter [Alphaproteobacteria bacterium]|nr:MATE family efflux transporter [Alphaproteobacteria bacterium]